jgi:hypothetical protein
MKMTKRILGVALVAGLLALVKPAAAQTDFSFAIGIPGVPFFGVVGGGPGPFYGPPPCGPPAYAPAPLYAPAPVYVPAPVYGPRVVYAPRRVFVPAYRPYGVRPHYGPHGPRFVARRYRGW